MAGLSDIILEGVYEMCKENMATISNLTKEFQSLYSQIQSLINSSKYEKPRSEAPLHEEDDRHVDIRQPYCPPH